MHLARVFRSIVGKFSDRPALIFDSESRMSYRELDLFSNQVARLLISRGVSKGDRVGLCLEKSALPYAAVVACWKLGAPYFFIDAKNPPLRTAKILKTCEPRVVLGEADAAIAQEFPSLVPEIPDPPQGDDPAYIMFTSGSTGDPKGAVISHANLLNFIAWTRTEYGLSEEDRLTNLNPLYFDNSVFDIYASLFVGAGLVPFASDVLADPGAIADKIKSTRCTVYFSVPTLLMYLQISKRLNRESFSSVRAVIFGGEGYPKPRLRALFDEIGEQAILYNVYGPTECTCICTSHRVTREDFADPEGLVPLGNTVGRFEFRLFGENQKPVAPGETGELYLGGIGVGLGYFRQPAETETAFVRNASNASASQRWYRTGDLVRVKPADGKLRFVGRKDSQIKHLGYRIELEEIRHALCSIPGVEEAVVLYRASAEIGAIIAIVGTRASWSEGQLRTEAELLLPKYMIPERIHLLETLPKNPNGKVDRRLLQERYASS